jgi:hypothetical protein
VEGKRGEVSGEAVDEQAGKLMAKRLTSYILCVCWVPDVEQTVETPLDTFQSLL